MKRSVLWIVGPVITTGVAITILALCRADHSHWSQTALWTVICLVSELFWLRTVKGDSVQSLAATAKVASLAVLDIPSALTAILLSTVIGNFVFRKSKWYRAFYNGSQLVLAGAAAGLMYHSITDSSLHELFGHSSFSWLKGTQNDQVAGELDRRFFLGLLVAGFVYIVVNNTLMAWLMSAMTGRSLATLWRENCLTTEEIRASLTLILLSPLLLLLYGMFGIFGILLLVGCLGAVYLAARRYLALTRAQDSIVQSERMAAMGDMAEEIGRKMGDHLRALRTHTVGLLAAPEEGRDERVLKSIQVIEANVHNLATLVEGLCAFSHKTTEKISTDLNALVRSTVDFVRPQNRFDHVRFELHEDATLPLVQVDPTQLQQVLINLLTNAADALKETDRPVKRIQVDTHFDSNTQKIRIAVTDNGPGIPETVIPRIFEPRFTTKSSGHGYGLSLVFRIAANHRGTIRATNVPGGGARFLLELPNA